MKQTCKTTKGNITMKKITSFLMVFLVAMISFDFTNVSVVKADTQLARQMEKLDRGLVAVKTSEGVFISWRLLGTEELNTSFDLYRDGVKINTTPILSSTNYLDKDGTNSSKYYVCAFNNGKEIDKSKTVSVLENNYLSVDLDKPASVTTAAAVAATTASAVGYEYSANDTSVADVDGDGEYEIIVKWDPSNSQDNSLAGYTGNVYIDAYKLNGKRLWRIDLGKNIRAGAHYTQFMAYDLDGDGKAEVACKTADGTVDGKGTVIGDATKDWRKATMDAGYTRLGYILEGPEYLTIFDGLTGAALKTTDYDPPRGATTPAEMKTMWGDDYGNRCDRFLACIAYLDGVHPSLVMCRGYYTRLTMAAYNWRGGELTKLWKFDSNDTGNSSYAGQGNHNLSVADVDGDGKDEIIYGSCAIDDNGKGIYSTGLGHGDAMHLGDLDPTRPGLELFSVKEEKATYSVDGKGAGAVMLDPTNGKIIWKQATKNDTGRGLSADIDPRYLGEEQWGSAGTQLYSAKGERISTTTPASMNFAIWWDGDLSRELLDGTKIDKWDYKNSQLNNLLTASECGSDNGTKANPCLQADLFGDWREEVIWRTADSKALHVYTTTNVTDKRMYTLMHDPVYRLGVAWQNVGYNQPPHTSFYLGTGMEEVKKPNIYVLSSDKTNSGGDVTKDTTTTAAVIVTGDSTTTGTSIPTSSSSSHHHSSSNSSSSSSSSIGTSSTSTTTGTVIPSTVIRDLTKILGGGTVVGQAKEVVTADGTKVSVTMITKDGKSTGTVITAEAASAKAVIPINKDAAPVAAVYKYIPLLGKYIQVIDAVITADAVTLAVQANATYITSPVVMSTTETITQGWVKAADNNWYMVNATGNPLTGWQKDSTGWTYMSPTTGAMQTGWAQTGGTWYYLKDNGYISTGWVKDGVKWYYCNADGSMASNTTVDGYTLDLTGALIE
jgi:rhamnogalacturonan endolyase